MKLVRKFKTFISIVIDFLYDVPLLFKSNKIYVVGYLKWKRGKLVHSNWGDDINIFLFEEISGCKIIPQNASYIYKFLPLKNYSFIGSIICSFSNPHTEVWGSGLFSDTINIKRLPSKFYSVRGPLTREVLINNGIKCPEKYGDPALLISKYYQPSNEKKYELGLIMHILDEANPIVQNFSKEYPDVLLISMRDYSHWHDIPDKICSCKRIASTSLHGLIVSDSYQVPNLWIQISDRGTFKYQDYFLSVKRNIANAYLVTEFDDLKNIYFDYSLFSKAKAANIDYDTIFNTCPIKERLKKWQE